MAEPSRVILVPGMHRSGTSAVTRVLNLLGAALPGNLMPPVPDNNELGFWESRTLMDLHDELLEELASSWDDPTPFPESWLESSAARRYEQKIARFITSEFPHSPLSVVKDPRICRFLGLWESGVRQAGAEPLAVIPCRHPVEVAWSLKDRDGLPAARSYLMWLRHLLMAERDSRSLTRAFVDFGRLLDDWQTVTNRLSRQLGVAWPCNVFKANNEIDAFLQRRQRHHAESPGDIDARDDVPDWVKRIYEALPRLEADPADAGALAEFDRVREEVAQADQAFSTVLQSYRDAEVHLKETQEALEAELSKQSEDLEELGHQANQALELITDLNHSLDKRTAEVDRLNSDLAASQSERAAIEAQLNEATRRLTESSRRIAELEAESKRSLELRREFEQAAAGTEGKLREARDEAAALRQKCQELAGTLERATRSAASMDDRRRDLQQIIPHIANRNQNAGRRGERSGAAMSGSARGGEAVVKRPSRRYLIASGLFDRAFYENNNPDVVQNGLDAVEHYVRHGAAEGRWPNPLFDKAYYAQQLPADELSGLNPLAHFIERGASQGLKPHPLFDIDYYLKTNPDVASSGMNPLRHYLRYGWKEHRNASIYFDSVYYETQLPGPVTEIGNPVVHYLETGAKASLDPHPLFSTEYYLSQNKKLREAGVNPLRHFIESGAREGFNPHPLFDTRYYLSQFQNGKEPPSEPLRHYLEIGALCGFDPNPNFESAFYLSNDKDLIDRRVNPLSHYVQFGANEGRATSRESNPPDSEHPTKSHTQPGRTQHREA